MGWGGVGAGRGVARRASYPGGWGGGVEMGPLDAADAAANYHQLGIALSARAMFPSVPNRRLR
jgi:hypothetical protein